jgi:hypothetical protein
MFPDFAGSYATTTQLVVSVAGLLLVYAIFKISTLIYNELTSPFLDPQVLVLYMEVSNNSQNQ